MAPLLRSPRAGVSFVLLAGVVLVGAVGCGDDSIRLDGTITVTVPDDAIESGFEFDGQQLADDRFAPEPGVFAGHCEIGDADVHVGLRRASDDLGLRAIDVVVPLDDDAALVDADLGGRTFTESAPCTVALLYAYRSARSAGIELACTLEGPDGETGEVDGRLEFSGCALE